MKLNRFGSVVALAAASSLTVAACGESEAPTDNKSETSAPESSAPAESSAAESESSAAESESSAPESSAPESSAPAESSDAPSESASGDAPAGAYPAYSKTEGLSGDLKGVGSSAQESAVKAWIAGYSKQQSGVTVNYAPEGSGAGVEQFLGGGTPWAGSDVALEDEEMEKAKEVCGPNGAINLPAYISPIAIPFNVPGVDELKLKPETIAKIFNGDIEKWNDEAIAADNEGVELPDEEITVVFRSDESGTTANFQDYLTAAAGDAWPHESSKEWPADGEGASKTAGVVNVVKSTEYTIGYADASAIGDLKSVQVGVGDEFVGYSPEAAAKVVDGSEVVEGRPEGDLAMDLKRDVPGSYPVVLVAYEIVCTQYDDKAQADKVKDFISYVISEEGQKKAADEAGSAPISAETATKIAESLKLVSAKG